MNNNNFFGKNRLNANMTIKDGAANYIVAYIMQFLFQFIFTMVLLATAVDSSFEKTFAYTCLICVINQSANIITPILYSKVLGQNFLKDIGFKWKLNIVQVILLLLISISTIVAFSPLANFFVELIIKTGYDTSSMANMNIDTPIKLVMATFFVCLLPAFSEELIYRGIIARSFKSKNVIFMILMSAFFFAIMHGTPIQLIHQFFLGAVCCIVYLLTRQIWAPIIVHFTNNFIAVIGNYIMIKTNNINTTTPIAISIVMIIIGLIALISFLYGFYAVCKKLKCKEINKDASMIETINILFMSDIEKKEIEQQDIYIQENLKLLDTDEKKFVYLNAVNENKQKNGLIDRRALIFALILGVGVWIINTLLAYTR